MKFDQLGKLDIRGNMLKMKIHEAEEAGCKFEYKPFLRLFGNELIFMHWSRHKLKQSAQLFNLNTNYLGVLMEKSL